MRPLHGAMLGDEARVSGKRLPEFPGPFHMHQPEEEAGWWGRFSSSTDGEAEAGRGGVCRCGRPLSGLRTGDVQCKWRPGWVGGSGPGAWAVADSGRL